MDKHAILAVKKNEPSIFLQEVHQGNSVWAVCVQNDVNQIIFRLKLCNANASFSLLLPFLILFEFSIHSASILLGKNEF